MLQVRVDARGADAHNVDNRMSQLDVKSIINRFGGRMELWRKLTARGHKITPKAIEKWTERGRIPMAKFIWLIALDTAEGRKISIHDHIKPNNEN